MATDVDVQYFSHLNGLVLSNNWGDMIRLLDTCLVNGLPLTSITSASIDNQGDITLNLYAAHNCMLFQIIELTGFAPSELNGKYRIKGTPTSTQLILKATHTGKSITAAGTAKLASLGYDIIFRDSNDVKRAYRAKNPTAQHPFIRVDEAISDGVNSYNTTYAKSAMVGLIENMTHIDDYLDPNKLQLPLDTTDFSKNWKIAGTGITVVRGWSRWYWARSTNANNATSDSAAPVAGQRTFTLAGNKDAFYLLRQTEGGTSDKFKTIVGCGFYDSALSTGVVPPWFLMSMYINDKANGSFGLYNTETGSPIVVNNSVSKFMCTKYNEVTRIASSVFANAITPDYATGFSGIYSASNISALEIPAYDADKFLRGTLKHVCYSGKKHAYEVTTPILSDDSMHVWDCAQVSGASSEIGGFYFYLGEL